MSPYNKLWTKTAFAKVPAMRSQDGKGDNAVAFAKLFCPLNGWRWYITEYDRETGEAFGLVQGHEVELGNFAVREVNPGDWGGEDMQSQNNNWRGRYRFPPFERDAHFTPTTLGKIRASIEAGNPA